MSWTNEKAPWTYRGLVVLNMAPVPIGALIDMIVEPRHNGINGTAAALILLLPLAPILFWRQRAFTIACVTLGTVITLGCLGLGLFIFMPVGAGLLCIGGARPGNGMAWIWAFPFTLNALVAGGLVRDAW
jgi:hypothetical protein